MDTCIFTILVVAIFFILFGIGVLLDILYRNLESMRRELGALRTQCAKLKAGNQNKEER